MTDFDYYAAPPDKVFNEIKAMCEVIWYIYHDNTYGYVDGKLNSISKIENVGDNTGYMVAMFDFYNQSRLMALCLKDGSEETQEYLKNLYDFAKIPY